MNDNHTGEDSGVPTVSGGGRHRKRSVIAERELSGPEVELGKQLYYDKRLSGDGTRACYSCHLKEKGLTFGEAIGTGAYAAKLTRSAPTMWNVGYYELLYWDGRAPSLERQVAGAWSGANMGGSGQNGRPSTADVAGKLNQIVGYRNQFQTVFGGPATADLTDQQFHNLGIGMDAEMPDLGRNAQSKEDKDKGAFKTPSLLDIGKSAPYFHNGSVATLEEAVDIMTAGGKPNQWPDTKNLKPAKLSKKEKTDLIAFLRSLDVTYDIADPTLP